MALGYLFLLFIGMMVISILGTIFLCLAKSNTMKNICFYGMAIWGMLIAYQGAVSQPINFIWQQVFSWAIGAVAIVGILVKYTTKSEKIANGLVIFSVAVGVWNLFFF